MKESNLKLIFKKYIDNFEKINDKNNNENYKWEIAYHFQHFDLNAPDFAHELERLWKLSQNLIDNYRQLPFYALVDYAKHEPNVVREMFKKLFNATDFSPELKQKAIEEFIAESEVLRQKYRPYSHLYLNNQRSVMMYLFLRYPNSNYAYKASQAKSFADCVEFYDDWGPMTNFDLKTYYKFCDQLVEEIKNCNELKATHRSRYEKTDLKLHSDDNFHILVFDIIYSSQTYGLLDGISYNPINMQTRKLYFERLAKAEELKVNLEKLTKDSELLEEAKIYFRNAFESIGFINHKTWGIGKISAIEDSTITVTFPSPVEKKIIGTSLSLINKIIKIDTPDFDSKLEKYKDVLKKENEIPNALKRAEEAIKPYLEYLE